MTIRWVNFESRVSTNLIVYKNTELKETNDYIFKSKIIVQINFESEFNFW